MSFKNDDIAQGLVAVTPADGAAVNFIGLVVGTAGNLSIVDGKGNTTTLPVVAGQTLGCAITQVRATGTTASVFGYQA